jgi:hypothetical protein
MAKCKEKLIVVGKAVWAEVTFWVEVFAAYWGWDRSPYHWVFEQHERDLEEAARQAAIDKKRAKYFKTN